MFNAVFVSALLVVLFAGCTDPNRPAADIEDAVLVAPGDSGPVMLLDPNTNRVIARSDPLPRFKDGLALAPDGKTLYLTAFEQIPGKELLALSIPALRIIWRERLSEIARRSEIGEMMLHGNYELAVTPDGSRLLVADAEHAGSHGVAVLDLATRNPVGFVGPFAVSQGGIAVTPTHLSGGEQVVLLVGSRTFGVFSSTGKLFVLDGSTLEIRDSAVVVPSTTHPWGGVQQVLPAPDGRYAYVVGLDRLYRYDLHDLTAAPATARRPSLGWLSASPADGTLYLTDPGDGRDGPGSGFLFVFGPGLERRDPIDVRAAASHGVAVPSTHRAVVSRDGSQVYVTAGTARLGPLFGFQPGRVLIVDASEEHLADVIPVGLWSLEPIFTLP